MAKRHILNLTDEQQDALHKLRDNGKQSYIRERAAAILKIGSGMSPHNVALSGLLKKRKPAEYWTYVKEYCTISFLAQVV